MRTVLDRGDSAHRLSVAKGEKELTTCLTIEWVRLGVERISDRDAERRNPLRVIRCVINLPWQVDKPAQIARGFDGDDLDGHVGRGGS